METLHLMILQTRTLGWKHGYTYAYWIFNNFLKCDNSNIQISERINRDDLILFKKTSVFIF